MKTENNNDYYYGLSATDKQIVNLLTLANEYLRELNRVHKSDLSARRKCCALSVLNPIAVLRKDGLYDRACKFAVRMHKLGEIDFGDLKKLERDCMDLYKSL